MRTPLTAALALSLLAAPAPAGDGPKEAPRVVLKSADGKKRYDLAKLRAKSLVLKVPGSQTYCLSAEGFRICVLFVKLAGRLYAPLAAAAIEPVPLDTRLLDARRSTLDHLYAAIDRDLDRLLDHLGLATAA